MRHLTTNRCLLPAGQQLARTPAALGNGVLGEPIGTLTNVDRIIEARSRANSRSPRGRFSSLWVINMRIYQYLDINVIKIKQYK